MDGAAMDTALNVWGTYYPFVPICFERRLHCILLLVSGDTESVLYFLAILVEELVLFSES